MQLPSREARSLLKGSLIPRGVTYRDPPEIQWPFTASTTGSALMESLIIETVRMDHQIIERTCKTHRMQEKN